MPARPADNETISSAQADYDTLQYVSAELPCPYKPGVDSRNEVYLADELDGAAYEHLLSLGFRRSGRVVYRPRCRTCHECRQLRIPVADFVPTRSMSRVTRRNSDVRVTLGEPEASKQKFELYRSYLDAQHDETMGRTYDSFYDFLYDSPTDTCELCYRLGGRLIGVSIVDRLPGGLSSVYMFFDPAYRSRSLGTFSVLWEVGYCQEARLPYYYLGYFVAGSRTMSYKGRFRPNEVLVGEDRWVCFRK